MNTSTPPQVRAVLDSTVNITGKERRFALELCGWQQKDLAAELNVHPSAVYRVIHGKTKSYKIASRIADITGASLSRLYPDGTYEISKEQAA